MPSLHPTETLSKYNVSKSADIVKLNLILYYVLFIFIILYYVLFPYVFYLYLRKWL